MPPDPMPIFVRAVTEHSGIKALFAGIATFLVACWDYAWHNAPSGFVVVLGLAVAAGALDLVTGLIRAIAVEKSFSAKRFPLKLYKVLIYFCAVCAAWITGAAVGVPLRDVNLYSAFAMATAATGYILAIDLLSVYDNIDVIMGGAWTPSWLRGVAQQMRDARPKATQQAGAGNGS